MRLLMLIVVGAALAGRLVGAPPDYAALLPAAPAEVTALLPLLTSEGELASAWTPFLTRHGANALPLLLALAGDATYQRAARAGFPHLVRLSDLDALLTACRALAPPEHERLLTLCDLVDYGDDDAPLGLRLQRLLNGLGEYYRACDTGQRAWVVTRDNELLGPTLLAIRRGALAREVWMAAGPRVSFQPEADARAHLATYYAELAGVLDMPEPVRAILLLAELDDADDSLLVGLVERLAQLGLRDEIAPLLQHRGSAVLRYQQFYYGQPTPLTADQWNEIFALLDTPSAGYSLAVLLEKHRWPQAERAWQQVFATARGQLSFTACVRLSRLAERRADLAAAATWAETAWQRLPPESAAHRADFAARVAELRRRARSAAAVYERHLALAKAALEDRRFAEAEAALVEASAQQPAALEPLLLTYSLYSRRHRYTAAAALADRLAPLTTDEPPLLFRLAFALVETQHLDAARAATDRLAVAWPDRPQVPQLRSAIAERAGDHAAALDHARQAYAIAPDYPPALQNLALAHARLGELPQALPLLTRLAESRHHEYAVLWLYLVRRRLGLAADAALADAVDSRLPQDSTEATPWLDQLLAHCLGRLDREGLLAAARQAPTNEEAAARLCEAWFYLGQLALIRQDREGARAAFQQCLAFPLPAFIEYTWAQAELQRLAP